MIKITIRVIYLSILLNIITFINNKLVALYIKFTPQNAVEDSFNIMLWDKIANWQRKTFFKHASIIFELKLIQRKLAPDTIDCEFEENENIT